ncbi:MAG: ABC transporter permease [Nitrospirae bacterium]|nr:ABC transporter permease [Nitrospirota bacterium]
MVPISIKNLLYDKTRFAITIVGVTFAVVLIFAQIGIYLGFMKNASTIIDNINADIWVTSKDSPNFDWSRPFPEKNLNIIKGIKGIEWAEKLVFAWTMMKLPDGGTEQIELIGYNPNSGIGAPWKMKEGRISDVKGGKYIIVDESAQKRLGKVRVGDVREIMDQKVKIAGISEGIKSLTTAPYIFTSYDTAKELAPYIGRDNTTFILVKVSEDFDKDEIIQILKKRLTGVSVYTREGYSFRTKKYWTISTGMGMGFLITAFLGFIIGMIIVGQTIYTSTVEHLREFGTLKAIGATNTYIYRIIIEQAIINAVVGYVMGLIAIRFLIKGYEKTGLDMVVPDYLMGSVFFITILMCISASFISIRKATRIDPVMVFRT